ncbi:hypothetical protein HDU93_001025 [Gonapodya sp. JEL0774]|nr:hypothetical protein HDU93_001025 [Gonapodya sp. JEL0774]
MSFSPQNTASSTAATKTPSGVRNIYNALSIKLEEIHSIEAISATLSWDQLVMMPAQAASLRSKQLEFLAGLSHDKKTDPELGKTISALFENQGTTNFQELNEYDVANLRLAHRSFQRASLVPKSLAMRAAELSSRGYEVWVEAREKSDWEAFEPILAEWIELRRETARCIDPNTDIYDVLLDDFEIGFTSARIEEIFSYLKAQLIPLVRAVAAKPQPDNSFLQGEFDIDEQTKFNHRIAKDLGFDTTAGRLDTSVHPFTTGSTVDVRMTTRYKINELMEGITGTVHETGHALYEQGLNREYSQLPAAQALSSGVHESQSLLWERMVGLSPGFWEYYTPILRSHFPQIPSVTISAMHRAINTSKPGYIRVEADELTYPLHVVLRFEIERDLILKKLDPKDVPSVWSSKLKEYLGIVPPSDREGALQDVHWSEGLIGYFPTYTLGAIMASMFYKQAEKSIPGLHGQISRGEFKQLREWLRVNIHRKGSIYRNADELCAHVCGRPIDPEGYVNYLKDK